MPPPGKYDTIPVDAIKAKAPGVGFGKAIRATQFPKEKVAKPEIVPNDSSTYNIIS